MNGEFNSLRYEVDLAARKLEVAKAALAKAESACMHKWSEAQAAHIYHESYTIPGDRPGTMGVDWRGPCHVPSRTDHRWKRTCQACGKEEFTTQVSQQVTHVPKFS